MRKCDNYFAVSCYRYAPESFTACFVKEFSNGNKNIPVYTKIKLNTDERSTCGNAYICKGRSAAIAELKKIIRKRERKEKSYCTYGNKYKDNPKQYAFTHYLECQADSLQSRLYAYKEWKHYCIKNNYEVSRYVIEEIQFDPEHPNRKATQREVKEQLDRNKPIKIHFRVKTLYQS